MKKRISVTIDESLWKLVKDKSNLSRYIEYLVKDDIQLKEKKQIVNAVVDDLLADSIFLDEVADRIKSTTNGITNSSSSMPSRGYLCCSSKSKVCRHWHWDGTKTIWINSVTGEERGE